MEIYLNTSLFSHLTAKYKCLIYFVCFLFVRSLWPQKRHFIYYEICLVFVLTNTQRNLLANCNILEAYTKNHTSILYTFQKTKKDIVN